MLKIHYNIIQGTDDWFAAKCGKVGASSFNKIITSKGARSTQRKAHIYALAGEILTGKKAESYSNAHMQNGLDMENESRELFAFLNNLEIEEVGGIENPNMESVFISPDGIIKGKEEGLELKNVLASTQVKYLNKGILPTEYKIQIQMSLAVTGWDIWHFFSYHPGLPPLYIKVPRDEELIKIIDRELKLFVKELNKIVQQIQ